MDSGRHLRSFTQAGSKRASGSPDSVTCPYTVLTTVIWKMCKQRDLHSTVRALDRMHVTYTRETKKKFLGEF